MGSAKTSTGRKIFNRILILLDLALLVWIVLSWRGQKKLGSTEEYYNGLGYDLSGIVSSSNGSGGSTDSPGGSADSSSNVTSNGNASSWLLDEPSNTQNGTTEPKQSSLPIEAAGRPEIGEFDSWSIPGSAREISDFSGITGTWKGFIRYDVAEELVSFTISGSASSTTLTVDWYLIHYFGDGSWENEENMEDTPYQGTWMNGALSVEGMGNFRIDSFYEVDGKQYAQGQLTTPTGAVSSVSMMRP